MKKSNKTPAERQEEYKQRKIKQGLKRFEFWLTEQEYNKVKRFVKELQMRKQS